MIKKALLALGLIAVATQPLRAQTFQNYSSYVLGLPPVAFLVGNEKFAVIQSTQPRSATAQQILGAINGDCHFTSSIICDRSNGAPFAPSAFANALNASNINQGTLASARMSPVALGTNGTNGGVVGQLTLGNGGCGGTTAASCLNNIAPTPTRAGDILRWNGTAWVTIPGNTGSIGILQEDASGNASWVAPGSGTVMQVNTGGMATGGPFTTSGTVTVTAAAKSDQQAASSSTRAVTPSQQQSHPSAAKAWVNFTGSGSNGAETINASYNVSSVTRTSPGSYTISFTTPFAATNYACSVTAFSGGSFGWGQVVSAATGSVSIAFVTISGGSLVGFDPVGQVICFGTQ
ncbi:hypothetical protein [Bradyrhizobium sp. Tv2a-2]|uniref:hypothetical protein n=1 Tax=Bradyrhizobium sp. Tv2a-2 TaxID=113395 RepID=UPI00041579CC|nr:hypothetical protein [Bradyrhizobium sp. Tv2a-2]